MQADVIGNQLLQGREKNKVFDNLFESKVDYQNHETNAELKKETFELDILDKEEIEIAQQRINEMHPLQYTPLYEVFPILCCLRKCFNNDEDDHLLTKNSSKQQKLIEDIKEQNDRLNKVIKQSDGLQYDGSDFVKDVEDMLNVESNSDHDHNNQNDKEKQGRGSIENLGFGISAYVTLLERLFYLFFTLSIFGILMMWIFHKANPNGIFSQQSIVAQYSLGNIGFTETQCLSRYRMFSQGNRTISCNRGLISNLTFYGMIAENKNQQLIDGTMVGNGFCGDSKQLKPENNCSPMINSGFVSDFYNICVNKKTCSFNAFNPAYFSTSLSNNNCSSNYTQIYYQFNCIYSDSEKSSSQKYGLSAVGLSCVIAIIYYIFIHQVQKSLDDDYKKWDVRTCTPADYTIEVVITDQLLEAYQEKKQSNPSYMSLDMLIINELEKQVQEFPKVLRTNINQEIKVASLKFGYKNKIIIKKLQQRGAFIGNGNVKAASDVDDQINQIVQQKLDKISTPVRAFVTFTSQEAEERCENFLFNKTRSGDQNPDLRPLKILDMDVTVQEAPEPSNIIWENLETTQCERLLKKLFAFVVIAIFLTLMFLIFTGLKTKVGEFSLKFPATQNCTSVDQFFFNQDLNGIDDDQYQNLAQYDKDATLKGYGAGYYMCYCKNSKLTKDLEFNDLCKEFQKEKKLALGLVLLVVVLVMGINMFIRTLSINLIDLIGYERDSQRVSNIMATVFISSFINTGILILLTNANFSYYSFGQVLPIRNQYSDLDENWYLFVGPSLVQTMFISAMMPYIEFLIAFTQKKVFRWMDRGFSCAQQSEQVTKKRTQFQFITLYAGPEYMMHYKYSTVMTSVFICFMYGTFIPILFLITCFGLANLYIVENLCIHYWYRKPPMYDEKLIKKALKILHLAPIFMFTMAYWALGNKQIFFNQPFTLQYTNKPGNPQHKIFSFDTEFGPDHLALIVLLLCILKEFFEIIEKGFEKLGCIKKEEDAMDKDVDENLPSYWDAMTGNDQKNWYTFELYYRKKLGIQNLTDDQLEKLRTGKINKDKYQKYIDGDCNYEILSSLKYQQEFQFQMFDMRNETDDFILSDQIAQVLNIDDKKSKSKYFDENKDLPQMNTFEGFIGKIKRKRDSTKINQSTV